MKYNIGDKVDFRNAMYSADGLFLGGDVGPYGPWQTGGTVTGINKHGNYFVEWPTYHEYSYDGRHYRDQTVGSGCFMEDCLRLAICPECGGNGRRHGGGGKGRCLTCHEPQTV